MGAATMLLAAARELAIRAVVSDSGFAALVPLLQSDTQYPGLMIPSILLMGAVYLERVVDFFTRALGPDTSVA